MEVGDYPKNAPLFSLPFLEVFFISRRSSLALRSRRAACFSALEARPHWVGIALLLGVPLSRTMDVKAPWLLASAEVGPPTFFSYR